MVREMSGSLSAALHYADAFRFPEPALREDTEEEVDR